MAGPRFPHPNAADLEAETVFYLRAILHDHSDPHVRVNAGRLLLEYVDREKSREYGSVGPTYHFNAAD